MDLTKRHVVRVVALVAITTVLVGCARPRAILRSDGPTMRELIDAGKRVDAQVNTRREAELVNEAWAGDEPGLVSEAWVESGGGVEAYTRDASNDIEQLFPKLQNPEIAIYVYPHLATDRRMPVPGYTTAVPLYDRYEYALPGETGIEGDL